MEKAVLPRFISDKFKFWSFVSMILLVFVHGYNLADRYLRPWSTVHEQMTPTGFAEYFLANGLFRFRIPMLFIISGYLFALHDAAPYLKRSGKRLRTLLLPYLIWSALALAMTYFLESIPFTRQMILDSRFFWMGSRNVLIHDYAWHTLLRRWLLYPVSYQLWFIRVLIVYSLAYPVIRRLVMHRIAGKIYFILIIYLWFTSFDILFVEGEGLLFFSLGIWLQKTNFNIGQPGRWLQPAVWGTIFVGLALLKTWLAFNGQYMMNGSRIYYLLIFIHRLVVFSGLIACWYGLDALVKWCMSKQWFVWLSAFSFIIYALHAPLVAYSINQMFSWLYPIPAYRFIAFLLLPLLIIMLSISLGIVLRRLAPRTYGVLTGGRGF